MPSANAALAQPQVQTMPLVSLDGTAQMNMLVGQALTSATLSQANTIIWQVWNETFVTTNAMAGNLTLPSITSANTTLRGEISTTNNIIWTNWNATYTVGAVSGSLIQPVQGSEEMRQRVVVAEAERAKARDRAARLLREVLSPEQAEELTREGRFHLDVLSKDGSRRRYRINRGRSRNVQQVEPGSGRVIKTLCAHPVAAVPDEDTMLAQKLMLETAEDDFLRMANVS